MGAVIVLVDWNEFEPEERTWEPLEKMHSSAPEFVVKGIEQVATHSVVEDTLAS